MISLEFRFGVGVALGFVSEFLAEFWAIRWTRLVNGRLPLSRAKMRLRVRRVATWTLALGALSWLDIGAVLKGLPLYAVVAGALLGGVTGSIVVMWRRWHEMIARLALARTTHKEEV